MTPGEKRLARRVEALLDDDYLCWYDIPVGRKNRYPDFIVLHPARGLLFLEVKDWRLENIKKISKHRVELLTNNGKVTAPNPIEQARQCAYQVIDMMQEDSQLVTQSGNYKGKLKFPYGYGVVFTHINQAQLNKALTRKVCQCCLTTWCYARMKYLRKWTRRLFSSSYGSCSTANIDNGKHRHPVIRK